MIRPMTPPPMTRMRGEDAVGRICGFGSKERFDPRTRLLFRFGGMIIGVEK